MWDVAGVQESHEFEELSEKVRFFDDLGTTLTTSLPKEVNLGMFEVHCEDLIMVRARVEIKYGKILYYSDLDPPEFASQDGVLERASPKEDVPRPSGT